MKKILIGTALAGVIVGTVASLSFAAPLPARLDNGSAIVQVDMRCGPHHHFVGGHRDRFGHWMSGHCVRNHDRDRDRDRDRDYR